MKLLLDIDGTISDFSQRQHFLLEDVPNWASFCSSKELIKDSVVEGVKEGLGHLINHQIINPAWDITFLTGRREENREATMQWLWDNLDLKPFPNKLIMRHIEDRRKATEYKDAMIKWYNLDNNHYIAMDDDLFMMPIYLKNGIIPFHAPKCWQTLAQVVDFLPEEKSMRA